jgi:hypothetical protein
LRKSLVIPHPAVSVLPSHVNSAVTDRWTSCKEALRYELQLIEVTVEPKESNSKSDEVPPDGELPDDMWKTVSDSLKGSLIKKKNLKAGAWFATRVRYRDSIDWSSFSLPIFFRTLQVDRLVPPRN